MTKFAPHVVSAEDLAARIFDHEQIGDRNWSAIVDHDGNLLPDVIGKYFVTQWPDHCVTEQHLGDAMIHGPFASREEAEAYTV